MTTTINRNYLEIKNISELSQISKPDKSCLVKIVDPTDFNLNKFFYKQIGKKYRWIDRLSWENKKWIEYVNNKDVKTYKLIKGEELIGYFEQIFNNKKNDCEIAYFGILEEYFGKNYGAYLLSEAIKLSFQNDVDRVWLHTCSLDHKNALPNYIARGMKIFKSEKITINTN